MVDSDMSNLTENQANLHSVWAKVRGLFPKKENKKIAIAVVALVCAVALLALIYFIADAVDRSQSNKYAVLFTKSDGDHFKSSKGGFHFPEDFGKNPVISSDSSTLYYFSSSKVRNGKWDLYCCDLNSKRRVKKAGIIVEYGVQLSIDVNDSGNFAVYAQNDEKTGETHCYLYDKGRKKSAKIDDNIKEVFFPPKEDCLFYTKLKDSKTALFRYRFYEEPELIETAIEKISFFKDADKFALICETSEEAADTFTLKLLDNTKEPIFLVSDAVSSVLYDDYVAGGVLYYFKQTEQEKAVWEDIITDDLKDKDSRITEPDRSDYLFIFGYSYQYRKAVEKYQAKLQRDELRKLIDRSITEMNLMTGTHDCYSFYESKSLKLGDGVSSGTISAVSAQNIPALVLCKYEYENNHIRFSELTGRLLNKELNAVSEAVAEVVKGASKPLGAHCVTAKRPEGVSLNISDEEARAGKFTFSPDGKTVFFTVKEENGSASSIFQITRLDSAKPKKEALGINASELSFCGEEIWYLKKEEGKPDGALYRYNNGKPEQIMDNVFSYICLENSTVLIFSNKTQHQSDLIADLHCFSGKKCELIDKEVDISRIRYNSSGDVAYIKGFKEETGGSLCVYIKDKTYQIAENVNSITLFA